MKKLQLASLVALAFSSAAFAQSTPAPSSGSLAVWFKAPTAGATVSGVLNGGTSCYTNASGSIARVTYTLDGNALNTDSTPSDGMQCVLDTTKFANGSHTLRANAYDTSGNVKSDVISINIQNTATTTNTPPTVSMTSPANGATVSGTVSYAATASDNVGVSKVEFYVDGALAVTDTSTPYSGSVDTTKIANGTHTIKAIAYDGAGLTASSQVSVNVQNTTATPTTTTSTPAPGSGTLDVWFKAPTAGATVSGILNGGTKCYVNGSGSIARVTFTVDGNAVNTDSTPADGMQCQLDTTKLANGSHSLRANAYDASGNVKSDVISINVQNSGTTSTPTTSNTPPVVSITAPAAGATISGTAAACAANATDASGVASVKFALNGTAIVTDTVAPYTCAIDTTKFANGTYTLSALATDALGLSSTANTTVTVANSTTSPTSGTGGVISSSDIIEQAQASIAFSQQSGYTGAVMGTYPDVNTIPESGINGPVLPNGETLRLGKQLDPTGTGKQVLAFQLSPNDPTTSGSKRSEFEFPTNIQLDTTYWVAYSVYVYNWGTLQSGDESLFGTQVHSSRTDLGLSPAFTVATFDGSTMRISVQYSTSSSPTTSNTVTIKYPDWSQPGIAIPFGRWVDFVFKFRESQSSSGFLQAWIDGSQVVNYSGPLGYNTPGYLDYFKFGYYNWSTFNSSRKVLLRSPVVVQDPTGSKYQASDLRSYVQAR
ncbi:MAG: Ig-like domain-containing protein [Clostridia bacterium]